MRTFAFGLAIVSLGCSVACGAPDKPPVADVARAAPVDSAGAATASDPYAGFDAGAVDTATDPSAGTAQGAQPPASTDLGADCQKMAAAWEKRARPAIKACYRTGKKTDPNLMGTARILVEVGYDAKVKPAKLDGVSSLGDEVANCMVAAVTNTPFTEASHCKSRQLTIPIEFPSKPNVSLPVAH